MSVSRLLSVISLIFCTAFLLQAEEPASFNGEITVTATGVKEESKDLPVPVTVISSEEIQDSQQSDLPELLRRVPGVIVMSSGGTGGVTSVFTRGTESDHTLVMFDGVRLNSPYFGGYDFSQLSTAGIERIEVIRGPYSALWGSDAVGGVVNLLPRRAGEGFHGAIFGEGGSDSWERWEGSVAWAHRGFDIYASGLKRKGDNGLDNSDFDLETGLVDTGWSFGDKSRIGLLYHQVDSELGIPFTSPGNPSPLRRQDVRQKTFAMPLSWNINPSWQLDVTASRVERDFRFSDPDDSWGFTSQHTNADTSEFRAVAHRRAGAHMLSFGGEWRRDEVSDRSSYGVNLDGKDLDTTGLIAQDDWKISKKIRLLLSARWDDTSEWGSRFSPRASLGWAFAENFGMRFSYGEAFRQPSLGELYFPGSGNPELKPEDSRSWEIGLVHQGSGDFDFRCELKYYHTDIDDLMNFDFINYRMENIGKADINGLEFVVRAPLFKKLSTTFQISRLDAENGEGEDLLRRPEWSGAFTIHGAFTSRLRGDLTLIYIGERPDIDPSTFMTISSPGFVTLDLALSAALSDHLDLRLRATNLLDRDYEEVAGYPSPGRRIMGGIRASF